jgi:hypothetical protein
MGWLWVHQDDENAVGGKRGSGHITMLQFYAYML